MSISYGGDSIQFADGTNIASGNTGFKNRIINGDMRIDQRNAGAAQINVTSGAYICDRFPFYTSQNAKWSLQQVPVTDLAGYTKAAYATISTTYTTGASDFALVDQKIEGFNVADLGWGTANAKPVTLSFWVKSNITGTFGVTVLNSAANRGFCTTYTIASAGVWTQASITITGDTTGTWLTNNGTGIWLRFGLGAGSTYAFPATNTWGASFGYQPSGGAVISGNTGGYWQVTGVDLRAGTYSSSPTWEFRSIGQELALCQRYFWKTQQGIYMWGNNVTNGQLYQFIPFPVCMRASPTVSNNWTSSTASGSIQSTSVHGINLGINATVGNSFSATYDTGNTINSEL